MPLSALYKKVTSASNLLCSSDSKFNFLERVSQESSVLRIYLIVLFWIFFKFSMFFHVEGDHTTEQYSTFDRTSEQYSVFNVLESFQ